MSISICKTKKQKFKKVTLRMNLPALVRNIVQTVIICMRYVKHKTYLSFVFVITATCNYSHMINQIMNSLYIKIMVVIF